MASVLGVLILAIAVGLTDDDPLGLKTPSATILGHHKIACLGREVAEMVGKLAL